MHVRPPRTVRTVIARALLLLLIGTLQVHGAGASLAQEAWKFPSPRPVRAAGDLGAFLQEELLPSIPSVPGSGATASAAAQKNHFVLPTPGQLAAWRRVCRDLLSGRPRHAHMWLKTISSTYNVVQYFDTVSGRVHWVVMEGVPGSLPPPCDRPVSVSIQDPRDPCRRGWGTFVFDSAPSRPLSMSAPHPKNDLETGDQAVEAYLGTGAHSLLLAGTDRDQNSALAACDQSSRPYLEADVAHRRDSVFQIVFEEIVTADPGLYHLQFHGNQTCDEEVFLSSGVRNPLGPVDDLAAAITATSIEWAAGGPVLDVDVYDSSGDCSLRATKNVQLRFAAGVPHAQVCDSLLPPGPSRFIHVESLRVARRSILDPLASSGRNRDVVIEAVRRTW